MLHKIPTHFLVAQTAMCKTSLELRSTDLSFKASREVALRHFVNVSRRLYPNAPSKRDITLLEKYQYRNVRDLGSWQPGGANLMVFRKTLGCSRAKETNALRRVHSQCIDYLERTNILAIFKIENTSLLLNRDRRRLLAEEYIVALLRLRSRLKPEEPISANQWGTDRSQSPANAKVTDPCLTFTTSIGPRRLSLKLKGTGSGILQGEIYGIIIANLDAKDLDTPDAPDIFSDHLHTVTLIQDQDVCEGGPIRVRGLEEPPQKRNGAASPPDKVEIIKKYINIM
jgi:hypothetical protein